MPEPLSEKVQELYGAPDRISISDLVEIELFAALSLRIRTGSLEMDAARRIAELFASHLEDGLYTKLHLSAGRYRTARNYIARFDLPLKSPDALHLAVCNTQDLTLLTANRQLARNADALDVDVELTEP